MKRRDVLKLFGAGILSLPILPRIARAQVRPGAPASRVLILNLSGGVRSSAAFLASNEAKYNPWGLIQNAGAIPFGQLLDDHLGASSANARAETAPSDAAYTLSAGGGWGGARVARFRESAAAGKFSVAGTWLLDRGDHLRARVEEVTGSANGEEPGILVRIFGALSEADAARATIPPIHLRPAATFGLAKGAHARYAPVSLAGQEALPALSSANAERDRAVGHDFAADEVMRERLDRAAVARRAGFGRELAEVFSTHRRASKTVGERLAQPFLHVAAPGTAAASFGNVRAANGTVPLTNAMMAELFGSTAGLAGEEYAEENEQQAAAMDVATAIRLLQLGSPAVAVELGFFDYHSDERRGAVLLYRFLGRILAAIEWLLSRIEDPEVPGASMLDRTLVVTMSDFGRDPGTVRGFNGGEGSDHGTDPSCFYLAHLAFGGGVRGGRLVGGVDTANYDARRAQTRFGPRTLLASMMWALGLPHADEAWGFPDVAEPISALWT